MPVSFGEVARIWRDWGLQPHRTETFKFSTDPQLEAEIRDVVGLYLDPPANAVVVCVDENHRSKLSTAPHHCYRCASTRQNAVLTTTAGTAPRPCSPRSRSPPERSPPTPATTGTATASSSPSSNRSLRHTRE